MKMGDFRNNGRGLGDRSISHTQFDFDQPTIRLLACVEIAAPKPRKPRARRRISVRASKVKPKPPRAACVAISVKLEAEEEVY